MTSISSKAIKLALDIKESIKDNYLYNYTLIELLFDEREFDNLEYYYYLT